MAFHPELRAEISFALDQQAQDLSDLDAMLKSFFAKDENWRKAEEEITERRSAEVPADTSLSDVIAAGVEGEVEFAYNIWAGDYAKAVESGRKVLDKISGPRPIAPYAALWCYYVASVAYEQGKTDARYKLIGDEFLDRAKGAVKTISWFSQALKAASAEFQAKADPSPLQALAVEGIRDFLNESGAVGPRFQRRIDAIGKSIHSASSKEFDQGLVELGRLLGFKSWRPEGDAVPDCVWQLGSEVAFLLEGKAEESAEDPISVQNCRQASGHLNWSRSDQRLEKTNCFTVLVSPRSCIDVGAVAHVDAVYLWQTSDVPKLFEKAKNLLVGIRTVMMAKGNQEDLRDTILQKIVEGGLTPEHIRQTLLSNPLTKIQVKTK